jgi:hypothetical protein
LNTGMLSVNPPCLILWSRVCFVVVAAFFEPTPREGKPLFAHERAVA